MENDAARRDQALYLGAKDGTETARIAELEAELREFRESIRIYLDGMPDSKLDGPDGLAAATFRSKNAEEARADEAEALAEKLLARAEKAERDTAALKGELGSVLTRIDFLCRQGCADPDLFAEDIASARAIADEPDLAYEEAREWQGIAQKAERERDEARAEGLRLSTENGRLTADLGHTRNRLQKDAATIRELRALCGSTAKAARDPQATDWEERIQALEDAAEGGE